MRALLQGLNGMKEYDELLQAVESGKSPVAAGGLGAIHKAHLAAALAKASGRPLFVLCPDDIEARRIAEDLAGFLGESVPILPTRELTLHTAETVSREWEHRRIAVLGALKKTSAAVASYEAAVIRTMPQKLLDRIEMNLKVGDEASIDSLVDRIVMSGYKRAAQVEGEGQFSVRGGILDLFTPGAETPYRIEFFGDEIDTIYSFDVSTQRRTLAQDSISVLPASETLPAYASGGVVGLIRTMEQLRSRSKANAELSRTLSADIERLENEILFPSADRYMDLIYQDFTTALDHLPEDALVVVFDHSRITERAKTLSWQSGEDLKVLLEAGKIHPKHAKFYADSEELYGELSLYPTVFLDSFIGSAYPVSPRLLLGFTAKQLPSYGGSLDTALSDIQHYLGRGFAVLVLCRNELRAKSLLQILEEHSIHPVVDFGISAMPAKGYCTVALGGLSAGLEYPALRLAVITEGQISTEKTARKKSRGKKSREHVRSYTDLTPGDYVVHDTHGVARFQGIAPIPIDGAERDYIKLIFAGTDVLYVPVTQLDMVSKYIGTGEDGQVRLNKLGGAEWARSKSKAKAAAKELAKELIQLYAERKRQPGYAFPSDGDWQKEFEEGFDYDETDDQLRATAEIKRDMESTFPMDRLLCGDVGFGKTEVAFRAAMKCILAGKQVALLAPTTVLAQQHYLTATRRFGGYPVNPDVMSRFRSPAQQKETLAKLRRGTVDFLIGTHRILQKDIEFKDLGLLIVDEEQRFGVTHKERLKEISRKVDVLTLTATPIPRTLNMALSGIRDLSTLEEAPRDRHPVQTYVLEYDRSVILDAIRRELGRGGQVYYLYNRVETIDLISARLSRDLEGVLVATAHGQMSEKELSDIMTRMDQGEIQVLVCTTIIETGIDIPNVNTLIIEDADHLGLSQLHQIRGRVGRSQRHAYAYLTYRKGKVLTEISEKRLNAIRDFAEFGAGFKIAMRDLEIRGAGNILGHAQSGHLINVGYDMYLKLLEEAVLEEQGELPRMQTECTADLIVSAGIPDRYIPDAGQRMDLYRRIALVRDDEQSSDLIDELCDRYGDIPKNVHTLIRIALLRSAAGEIGISEIAQKESHLNFTLPKPDLKEVSMLCSEQRYKRNIFFSAGDKPYLSLRITKATDTLAEAEHIVKILRGYRLSD